MARDPKSAGGRTAPVEPTAAAAPAAAPAPPEAKREPGPATDPTDVATQPEWSSWHRLWQVPAIILSVVLIALGIRVAATRGPGDDFDSVLTQAEQLLAAGRLDEGHQLLAASIEPNLQRATAAQQARFHALAGDWLTLAGAADPTVDRKQIFIRAAEQYTTATSLGRTLTVAQLERWALAALALGQRESARQRVAQMDALATGPDGPHEEVARRRNGVLRRLIEDSLRDPDLPLQDMMQLLTDYRGDRQLRPIDEAWAVARQAELRMDAGQIEQAIDRLLVDMRRLEARLSPQDAPAIGELYTGLGRAYLALGRNDEARGYLQEALRRFEGPDVMRGRALALLGAIAAQQGRHEEALERFDESARDYVNTTVQLAGLLGRAEVLSILGDHARSVEDYAELSRLLTRLPPQREVTPERIARSLCDRHDASLAAGNLPLALRYIQITEQFFGADQAPAEVLLRLASTSRQLADDIEVRAKAMAHTDTHDAAATADPARSIALPGDPALLSDAAKHYRQAGQYYLRHSQAIGVQPGDDRGWADSLWMSADSFDRAGWYDEAVTQFSAYLAGTSPADPRRAEAMFRLGQGFQARSDDGCASAMITYEQLIADFPRSPYAARSQILLAQCYLVMGRRQEAEQQLQAMLLGERLLTPDADDYRAALLTLGTLYYENGDYARAIEQFDSAIRRYPADARYVQTLFRLADSYRGYAARLRTQAQAADVTRMDRDQLDAQRIDLLHQAEELFDQVIDGCERAGGARPDRDRADLLRHAHFYRADCAFELGQYERAIELYDYAARSHADHHASMLALVQIVNCYHLLGDEAAAQTAHARALLRLAQLPDRAFAADDALLNRAAWEAWLIHHPIGRPKVASASGS